jgi:hypothetical protein
MWFVLLGLSVVGAGVLAKHIYDRRRREEVGAPSEAAPAQVIGRNGAPPHPAAFIVELPGLRLIDLRALPVEDLAAARLGVVQAQLALERPVPLQVWVVEVAIARGWAALSEVARVIAKSRLCDTRDPSARNLVYPIGGQLTDDEVARLRDAGIDVVLELTNLSDPPRRIEDLLAAPPPWTASRDVRPVPPHDVIGDHADGEVIHIIEHMAFVDLRRVPASTWSTGVAQQRLSAGLRELAATDVTHVVWVVAPWVLEIVDDLTAARLEALADAIPRYVAQRLAVVAASGEPVGPAPLLRRLNRRLPPLHEVMAWETADRGTFAVRPLDALHDAYFTKAWRVAGS